MSSCRIILAILLVASSCNRQPQPGSNDSDEEGASYLALGDSYTIGQSVDESERWPVLLADALTKSGQKMRSPHIIATTGWTTGDLLLGLQNYQPTEKFDRVSLLIGVNNQYQGRSLDEYRIEFRTLLEKSIGYAGGEPGRVFVLSIPDWGVTPFGQENREEIAKEIDMFNQAARDECEKKDILFLDVTTLSRKALNDPTLIARDRLHFSGKMYQQWVSEILPKISSVN